MLQRREIKIDLEGQGQGLLQGQGLKGQEVGTERGGQGHVRGEKEQTENIGLEGEIFINYDKLALLGFNLSDNSMCINQINIIIKR
jgi:hypothetical protein